MIKNNLNEKINFYFIKYLLFISWNGFFRTCRFFALFKGGSTTNPRNSLMLKFIYVYKKLI